MVDDKHLDAIHAILPKVTLLRLRKDCIENAPQHRHATMGINDAYAVLAEVDGREGHYIVMNVTRGVVVPGNIHLNRFEVIPKEEL